MLLDPSIIYYHRKDRHVQARIAIPARVEITMQCYSSGILRNKSWPCIAACTFEANVHFTAYGICLFSFTFNLHDGDYSQVVVQIFIFFTSPVQVKNLSSRKFKSMVTHIQYGVGTKLRFLEMML